MKGGIIEDQITALSEYILPEHGAPFCIKEVFWRVCTDLLFSANLRCKQAKVKKCPSRMSDF
ncbi:MAG: hypothetical protein DWQ05_05725 [Calditrichaeota bacterium]|nr:MAG: hypothetical protein DWQ05_05725 [Calditrichota bacterium]